MSSGEFLTRSTSGFRSSLTQSGVSYSQLRDDTPTAIGRARLAWTIGCAALVAHFICAFNFYHAWSHESAYIDTARQTAAVFAINWGGGLFINYAVAILWITDVAWWWFAGLSSYRQRPWLLTLIWHSFLIFIIFNATVVFEDGLARWIGLLVCLTMCLSWMVMHRQRSRFYFFFVILVPFCGY